eukprot:SAG31_NODE_2319_length_5944_cov_9.686056_8_plen_263_part_00
MDLLLAAAAAAVVAGGSAALHNVCDPDGLARSPPVCYQRTPGQDATAGINISEQSQNNLRTISEQSQNNLRTISEHLRTISEYLVRRQQRASCRASLGGPRRSESAFTATSGVRVVTFSFLCPLSERYGTFIARCNALIEKVSPFRATVELWRRRLVLDWGALRLQRRRRPDVRRVGVRRVVRQRCATSRTANDGTPFTSLCFSDASGAPVTSLCFSDTSGAPVPFWIRGTSLPVISNTSRVPVLQLGTLFFELKIGTPTSP